MATVSYMILWLYDGYGTIMFVIIGMAPAVSKLCAARSMMWCAWTGCFLPVCSAGVLRGLSRVLYGPWSKLLLPGIYRCSID